MHELTIETKTPDSVVNIALDAVKRKKQALVFVGTKRSAERMAEEISKALPETDVAIAEQLLHTLSKPTKQCERLGRIARHGVAFHHAGLDSKQKSVIEEQFRKGGIKVIACTPTLAYGLDLPAYRVVIRDVKRYGKEGMGLIPVLDYLQMAGRAGRPSFDDHGEAVLVADTESEAEELLEHYVHGLPEEIYSKLAVEPVLRTYVLSLIATGIVRTRAEMVEFFSRTFWAHQYGDMRRLAATLDRMAGLLEEWRFIESSAAKADDDFASADTLLAEKYAPTILGTRVAQLYLDPLTAHELIEGIRKAATKKVVRPFAILHLLCNRLEMRPRLHVGVKEWEEMQKLLVEHSITLLENEPVPYDPEYDEFLASTKTAAMLDAWMDERTEDQLLEKFNTPPGELHTKLRSADWLLYACSELAGLVKHKEVIKEFNKIRFRLEYGVREELLALLQLQGIGRVRARLLFNAGIKTLGDVRKAPMDKMARLIGNATAAKIKKAVGEDVDVPEEAKGAEKPVKKGQVGLDEFAQ